MCLYHTLEPIQNKQGIQLRLSYSVQGNFRVQQGRKTYQYIMSLHLHNDI